MKKYPDITTLDRASLTAKIGALPPDVLTPVEKVLLSAVDIRRNPV